MTNRLDEMVERALSAKCGAGDVSDMLLGGGDEEVSIMRAALTNAGVPSLLAEVERLKFDRNECDRLWNEWIGIARAEQERAETAEAELQALRGRIEAAPVGVVLAHPEIVEVVASLASMPAIAEMNEQRVRLLPAPNGEVSDGD